MKSAIKRTKAEYFEGIRHDVARNPSRTWKQLNKVLGRSHTQRVSMLKSTMGGDVFEDGALLRNFVNSLQTVALVTPMYEDNQP